MRTWIWGSSEVVVGMLFHMGQDSFEAVQLLLYAPFPSQKNIGLLVLHVSLVMFMVIYETNNFIVILMSIPTNLFKRELHYRYEYQGSLEKGPKLLYLLVGVGRDLSACHGHSIQDCLYEISHIPT